MGGAQGGLLLFADLETRDEATDAGVWNPMPECRCSWLYYVKNSPLNTRASSMHPKRPRNVGQYFKVLKADSEIGLSLET